MGDPSDSAAADRHRRRRRRRRPARVGRRRQRMARPQPDREHPARQQDQHDRPADQRRAVAAGRTRDQHEQHEHDDAEVGGPALAIDGGVGAQPEPTGEQEELPAGAHARAAGRR